MFNNNPILKEEFDKLFKDIEKAYNQSGKKVTGNFMKEIEISQGNNTIKMIGENYLEGRKPGEMPPVAAIEKWIKAKGLSPIENEMKVSSLAYIIARKIGEKGTKGIDIYGEVVTPQRIDEIIKKISVFNTTEFVDAVTLKLKELEK